MPTPHLSRIIAFMEKAKQEVPDKPCIPSGDVRVLRAKLILEEALETVRGLGVHVMGIDRSTKAEVLVSATDNQLKFYDRGEDQVDIEEVADGCADVSVVTMGTLIAFGIDDEPILEAVDEANLSKFHTPCPKCGHGETKPSRIKEDALLGWGSCTKCGHSFRGGAPPERRQVDEEATLATPEDYGPFA